MLSMTGVRGTPEAVAEGVVACEGDAEDVCVVDGVAVSVCDMVGRLRD